MTTENYLLLDVRNHDEISNLKYNDCNNKYSMILYIPSNEIKFNLEFLESYFKNFSKVFIICNSGNRSKKVKNKYFSNNSNVLVVDKNFKKLDDKYIIKSDKLHLSLTRKIQIIMGCLLLGIYLFSYYKKNIIYILPLLATFMLYVGISGNCFMSSILTRNDI